MWDQTQTSTLVFFTDFQLRLLLLSHCPTVGVASVIIGTQVVKKLAWVVKWRAHDLQSEGCFLISVAHIANRSVATLIGAFQGVSGSTGRCSLDDLKQLQGGIWHAVITSMATALMDVWVSPNSSNQAGEGCMCVFIWKREYRALKWWVHICGCMCTVMHTVERVGG